MTVMRTHDLPSDLGGRIRALRLQHGMTQSDVAEQLGRHLATVSEWERGLRPPTIQQLQRLAVIFDVRIEHLADAEVSR